MTQLFPDGPLLYVAQWPANLRAQAARLMVHSPQAAAEREIALPLNALAGVRWMGTSPALVAAGIDVRNRFGVFQIEPQSGRASLLVQSDDLGAFFCEAAGAPDGGAVYYKLRLEGTEPSPLFRRDLRTGSTVRLVESVYRYSLSPDGLRLAFSSFDAAREIIAVIPSGGGPAREIFSQPRSRRIASLVWAPNGRYLLFSRGGALFRISQQGGSAEPLGLTMEDLRDLRLHPSGSPLAFTAGKSSGEAWVMENLPSSPPARFQ